MTTFPPNDSYARIIRNTHHLIEDCKALDRAAFIGDFEATSKALDRVAHLVEGTQQILDNLTAVESRR